MSIFKCKMCSGTIEFAQGATVGECDSCGTKQTLPRLDDDRRANLYDRANHFRRNNDFDNVKLVNLLLEKGADPNCERKCEDGRKFSPLFDSVAVWPNDEIAERLISAGADVNYCAVNDNEIAYPVLSCAVRRGNVRIVSMLLRKGANPNCERVFKNGGKISALRDSIVTWSNNAIVNLLATYTTDFPSDIRGLSVRRTDLSKESIKALRKAGCLIPLF